MYIQKINKQKNFFKISFLLASATLEEKKRKFNGYREYNFNYPLLLSVLTCATIRNIRLAW